MYTTDLEYIKKQYPIGTKIEFEDEFGMKRNGEVTFVDNNCLIHIEYTKNKMLKEKVLTIGKDNFSIRFQYIPGRFPEKKSTIHNGSISHEKVCPTCGKEMYIHSLSDYIYTNRKNDYDCHSSGSNDKYHLIRYFCSYKCFNEYKKYKHLDYSSYHSSNSLPSSTKVRVNKYIEEHWKAVDDYIKKYDIYDLTYGKIEFALKYIKAIPKGFNWDNILGEINKNNGYEKTFNWFEKTLTPKLHTVDFSKMKLVNGHATYKRKKKEEETKCQQ